MIRNSNQQDEAFCKVCSQVIRGGITHVNRHAASQTHKRKINSAKGVPRITQFYNKKKEEKIALLTKAAELKILGFIAEHNLAFSVLDHLPQLISSVCPDSEIAKKNKTRQKERNQNLQRYYETRKFTCFVKTITNLQILANYR